MFRDHKIGINQLLEIITEAYKQQPEQHFWFISNGLDLSIE